MKYKTDNCETDMCQAVGKAVLCATAVVCTAVILCACFKTSSVKKIEKRLRGAYDIAPEDY
jgi:hypothetical protein